MCVFQQPVSAAITRDGSAGVYTFRDLDDVERLQARLVRSHRLLVLGVSVFSAGQVGEREELRPARSLGFAHGQQYRRLLLQGDRLVGALAIGPWPEQVRVRDAILRGRRLRHRQLRRFVTDGRLWPETDDSVLDWPPGATVCQCTGVSRGRLDAAIRCGCRSLAELRAQTGAGTVCGSCKPLLAELLGGAATPSPERLWRGLLAFALLTLLLLVPILLGIDLPYRDSVTYLPAYDGLWRSGVAKQSTGYTLLGLSSNGLLLSLRKRIPALRLGDFALWRVVHVLVGLLALVSLGLHAGFRLGHNLDRWLMMGFCAVLVSGVAAGLLIALTHRLRPSRARWLRGRLVQLHWLLFWPVPLLLGFHVLKIYWF